MGTAAGRGAPVVWHAYSARRVPARSTPVTDRHRPWFNARGQRVSGSVAELHGDTVDQARLGNALGKQFSLTGKTPSSTVLATCRTHDNAGSMSDGRAYGRCRSPCSNYTSASVEPPARGAAGAAPPPPGPSVQLGHSDKQGGNNSSWNSSHASRGCSQPNLVATGGAGLLYCFAVQ
jgi:hypothetical protein